MDGAQLVGCGLARKIRRAASVEAGGGEDQRVKVGLCALLNLAAFLQSICPGRPQPVDRRAGWAPGPSWRCQMWGIMRTHPLSVTLLRPHLPGDPG